ncbi:glycine betaine ABC transporter substrate-binding protein [Roseofilum sp. Guam]|uniref:glycine betaine ABC transporter substrate-binding protein n=1 Tax=Roseofilum sp. Guam TaxID=2821502 RepID=UPI00298D6555|nr:glycine betaine ABC transporter substrate-binding protein [Roseofilum sp. Guam]
MGALFLTLLLGIFACQPTTSNRSSGENNTEEISTDLPESQGDVSEADTTVNGKNFGFAVENLRIVANRKFVEVNPAASKLFELIKIPIEDINAQNKLVEEGEDSFEDIDRHVDEWIAKNQDVFDSWIEQAIESDYR